MTPEERTAYVAAMKEKREASPSRGNKESGGVGAWLKRLPQTAKKVVGDDLKSIRAGVTSAADALTMNTAPSYSAGSKAGGPLMGMLNMASQITNGGDAMIDSSAERAKMDSYKEGHPVANTVGAVGGSLLGAGKVGSAVKGAKSLPTAAKSIMDFAGRNVATKAGTAGVLGGVHGGVSARSMGESEIEGATVGAVTGLVAQSAIEGAMAGGRYFLNTGAPQRVIDNARSVLRSSRGVKELDADQLLARRAQLGPDATLADVDPSMTTFAKKLMYDPSKMDDVAEMAHDMRARLVNTANPAETVRGKFKTEAQDVINTLFERPKLDFDNPRTVKMIQDDIKRQTDQLQPLYNDLWDTYSTVKVKPDRLQDMANLTLRNGRADGAMSKKGAKFMKEMDSEITRLMKDRGDYLTPTEIKNSVGQLEKRLSARTKAGADIDELDAIVAEIDATKARSVGNLLPEDIQTLRLATGNKITALLRGKSPDRETARRLISFKQGLEDDYLNHLPGFKDLNDTFAEAQQYTRAAELGRKSLTMKPDELADMELELLNMSPANREGYLEGWGGAFIDSLDTPAKTGKTMKKLNDSESFRNSLSYIMDDEAAERFIRAADTATQLQRTASELTGNSLTAERLVAGQNDAVQSKFNVLRIVGGAWKQILGGTRGTSQAAMEGATSQEIRRSGIRQADAQMYSNMTNAKGPEADAWINDIVSGKLTGDRAPAQTLMQKAMTQQTSPLAGASAGAAMQQGNLMSPDKVTERHNLMMQRQQ